MTNSAIKMYEVYEHGPNTGDAYLLLVTSDGVHARQAAQEGDTIAECVYVRIDPED